MQKYHAQCVHCQGYNTTPLQYESIDFYLTGMIFQCFDCDEQWFETVEEHPSHHRICPHCQGMGKIAYDDGMRACNGCGGDGSLWWF